MVGPKRELLLLLSVSMCVTRFMWVGEDKGGEEKKKKEAED